MIASLIVGSVAIAAVIFIVTATANKLVDVIAGSQLSSTWKTVLIIVLGFTLGCVVGGLVVLWVAAIYCVLWGLV